MWGVLIIAVLQTVYVVGDVFYPEPSAVVFEPIKQNSGIQTDFGYSVAYHNRADGQKKILVGAPSEDADGKVYSCDLKDLRHPVKCSHDDINITKLTEPIRQGDQNFYMGASFAVTPQYYLTCAPLWSSVYKYNNKLQVAFGTCFIKYNNGTTAQYYGNYEIHRKTKADTIFVNGGVGWSLLSDETFIIIPKHTSVWTISYLNISDVEKPVKNIRIKLKSNNKLFDNINSGCGLASGKEFIPGSDTYAFNSEFFNRTGTIMFASKSKGLKRLEEFVVTDDVSGSMFGHAMVFGDLNLDGRDELIVGAPTRPADEEFGAVHVYIGGDLESLNERKRTIIGSQAESRFGAAVAVANIDGDHINEIIVGAPYEDTGVVYILSGYELKEFLFGQSEKQKYVTELKRTQKIRNRKFVLFGFSVRRIPDMDNNGCDELVVGAPGSAAVQLLRCPSVANVTVDVAVVGGSNVREQNKIFNVTVCITLAFKETLKGSSKLNISNAIVGIGAHVVDPNYEIDLPANQGTKCRNITVEFDDSDPNRYKFTTKAKLVNPVDIFESTDFDPNWVVLSPYSVTESSVEISHDCDSELDCKPKLDLLVLWSGVDDLYTIGKSNIETVNLTVTNEGHSANEPCLKIYLKSGAVPATDPCGDKVDSTYTCLLKPSIKRNSKHEESIVLNMKKLTNLDKELLIVVELYEKCDQKLVKTEYLNVTYLHPVEKIKVYGSSDSINVTETVMSDPNSVIGVDHKYMIENECEFPWLDMVATFSVKKQPFIQNVLIIPDSLICTRVDSSDSIINKCLLNLSPNAREKITAHLQISKTNISVGSPSVHLYSDLSLMVSKSYDEITASVNSTVSFPQELTIGNNYTLIIVICVSVAILLIIIIVIVLYTLGYFKRKEKEKLDNLRRSVRRHSIRKEAERRESQKRSNNMSGADDDGIDMVIEDNDVFEARRSRRASSASGAVDRKSQRHSRLVVAPEIHNDPSEH